MNRRACTFTIAAALLGGSAAAADPDNASYSIGITGFVPVICHAQLDASVVPSQSGETSLGQLNEYCNNPNGYRIFAESSPELDDATLLVDGEAIALKAGASTLVVSEDGPSIASRQVSLVSNGAAGSLTFRLVLS